MPCNPLGVGGVIVVADLQQHRGHLRLAHLPQGGGGAGRHQLGQGIDLLQIRHEDVGGPPAVGAGGIVKGDDAPLTALAAAVAAGVGVEGQIEVVAAPCRLGDGGGSGHLRRVAGEADGIGPQIWLHGVGDAVHPVLLAAGAGDVGVILLCGGT